MEIIPRKGPFLNFDVSSYNPEGFFDEMFEKTGVVRPHYQMLYDRLVTLGGEEIGRRRTMAEAALMNSGITFTVYKEEAGIERIFPFDLIPRIIPAHEWNMLEKGLKQRLTALNLFLSDVYNEKKIIKDGVIEEGVVLSADGYRKVCEGWKPPKDRWIHISGIDLIRGEDGQYYILEDNLRTPSGVSYVLENRNVLKRIFPSLFPQKKIRTVIDYPSHLRDLLSSFGPEGVEMPKVVVLTPGIYNSAYFEHSFLAREMGVQLVEGRDLVVDDGYVKMRTTRGLEIVDVIYRRIDDDFLDPKVFRKESVLGVPGLWEVYRNGRVALANAIGNGIADDKMICAYVPEMIKYYLDEEPILSNVPTYICDDPKQCQHVLENIENLVVKAVNQSGGYGMLIGPASSKAECDEFREKVRAHPRQYIAQPVISLSRVPTMTEDSIEGRHVDLRPFILYGEDFHVLPGGLTRVALRKGSLVVNSSQGGGSKDTWVLTDDGPEGSV